MDSWLSVGIILIGAILVGLAALAVMSYWEVRQLNRDQKTPVAPEE